MIVANCASTLFNPSFSALPSSPPSPPPPPPPSPPPVLFLFLLLCDICLCCCCYCCCYYCCSCCCCILHLLANSLSYLLAFLSNSCSVSSILLRCPSSLLLSFAEKYSSSFSSSLPITVGIPNSSVFSPSSKLSNSLFKLLAKNPKY